MAVLNHERTDGSVVWHEDELTLAEFNSSNEAVNMSNKRCSIYNGDWSNQVWPHPRAPVAGRRVKDHAQH